MPWSRGRLDGNRLGGRGPARETSRRARHAPPSKRPAAGLRFPFSQVTAARRRQVCLPARVFRGLFPRPPRLARVFSGPARPPGVGGTGGPWSWVAGTRTIVAHVNASFLAAVGSRFRAVDWSGGSGARRRLWPGAESFRLVPRGSSPEYSFFCSASRFGGAWAGEGSTLGGLSAANALI